DGAPCVFTLRAASGGAAARAAAVADDEGGDEGEGMGALPWLAACRPRVTPSISAAAADALVASATVADGGASAAVSDWARAIADAAVAPSGGRAGGLR